MVSRVVLSSDVHSDVFGKPGTRIVSEYSGSTQVLAEYSNNPRMIQTQIAIEYLPSIQKILRQIFG